MPAYIWYDIACTHHANIYTNLTETIDEILSTVDDRIFGM